MGGMEVNGGGVERGYRRAGRALGRRCCFCVCSFSTHSSLSQVFFSSFLKPAEWPHVLFSSFLKTLHLDRIRFCFVHEPSYWPHVLCDPPLLSLLKPLALG